MTVPPRIAAVVAVCAAWIAYVGVMVLTETENPVRYVLALCAVASAFVGLGAVTWARRPRNRVGPLMVAIGVAWLVPFLRYAPDSLPWTLALLLPTLHQALLVHLLFAYPSGRIGSAAERALVVAGYAAATAGSALVAVFQRDPAAAGFPGFPHNLVLLDPDVGVWRALRDGLHLVHSILALAVLALVARRVLRASGAARRRFAPILFGGLVAALLFSTGYTTLGYASRFMPEFVTDWRSFRWVVVAAYAGVPFAFAFGMLRSRLARSAVADLVIDLDRAPSSDLLRASLVKALRDPSLALASWDPAGGRYVDGDRRPVELPPPGSARSATLLERDGRRAGVLLHDAALDDDPGLLAAVAGAARLGLDNARLQDELREQLDNVRASRARLVEAGMAERRRLERNLHDGAQQHLVRLALLLELARAASRNGHGGEPESLLAEAAGVTRAALADLRALANGLHPAILDEEGLAGAIDWLAEASPVPVRVAATPDDRLPETVEEAAYYVVAEALVNVAKYARATHASVSARRVNGTLVVDVADDGVGGADPGRGSGLAGLADRISALDGRLALQSPAGGGTRVHAEIPCA